MGFLCFPFNYIIECEIYFMAKFHVQGLAALLKVRLAQPFLKVGLHVFGSTFLKGWVRLAQPFPKVV
jgi:hypothetical protein